MALSADVAKTFVEHPATKKVGCDSKKAVRDSYALSDGQLKKKSTILSTAVSTSKEGNKVVGYSSFNARSPEHAVTTKVVHDSKSLSHDAKKIVWNAVSTSDVGNKMVGDMFSNMTPREIRAVHRSAAAAGAPDVSPMMESPAVGGALVSSVGGVVGTQPQVTKGASTLCQAQSPSSSTKKRAGYPLARAKRRIVSQKKYTPTTTWCPWSKAISKSHLNSDDEEDYIPSK
mmetsp:Transcript_31247/g.57945  ORF Transcript_31247/g.57945 Transcript_31247/m.57945 type:complete len:230 (+) Transcript_31247:109-798(+)|eukprot:CAMPEP_0196135754 /NCGR_PEP_ID=MMETSP0910-20130528/4286_1 /TAXON_ID=49265 /ORGANISM="Thalassiosira rotula, Strain GSO102" /LENGTH=229 /DNA_ID=CAMNT_0041395941 /DNA_START=79 /DNA_END=768 /DNA_ORIENTATION=+